MGNSGGYIVFGILTLILVPIVMAGIGNTIGVSIDEKNNDLENQPLMIKLAEYFNSLENVPFIGSVFGFLGNMFEGYAIFPYWFNIIIFTLPVILIMRGVVSSG